MTSARGTRVCRRLTSGAAPRGADGDDRRGKQGQTHEPRHLIVAGRRRACEQTVGSCRLLSR